VLLFSTGSIILPLHKVLSLRLHTNQKKIYSVLSELTTFLPFSETLHNKIINESSYIIFTHFSLFVFILELFGSILVLISTCAVFTFVKNNYLIISLYMCMHGNGEIMIKEN